MDIQPHAVPAPPAPATQLGSDEEKTEEKGSGVVAPAETSAEVPFTQYEQMKGEPYTIRYFGLQDWNFFLKNPHFDESGIGSKVRYVEKFVSNEIDRKNLYDSPESYRAIMNDIKTKLNIGPLDRSDLVFDKIHGFIKSIRGKSAYGK